MSAINSASAGVRVRAEARAWREIAEKIDGPLSVSGLCSALADEYWTSEEGFDYEAARDRLNRHRADHRRDWSGTFVYPPHVRGPRVLAALWLALEAESEAHALTPKPSRPAKRPSNNSRKVSP